jgi:hypothetical protein
VASRTSIREDDALATVPLRGALVERPGDQPIDHRVLAVACTERDVPLDRHRSGVMPDHPRTEAGRECLGVAHRRRQVDTLGLAAGLLSLCIPEAGDEPIELRAPGWVAQLVHLVDDNGPHIPQPSAGPQRVIDALVCADDDVRTGVKGGTILLQSRPSHPQRHLHELPVPVLEVPVLLVRQGDQRDQKQQCAVTTDRPIDACELTDERLARRGRTHHQQILPIEQPRAHRRRLHR